MTDWHISRGTTSVASNHPIKKMESYSQAAILLLQQDIAAPRFISKEANDFHFDSLMISGKL